MEPVDALPSDLVIPPLAQTTYVYASDGKTLLTEFYQEDRTYTPITKMSPYIQEAIVASEDSRFYDHNGVDLRGVARAFVANDQSGQVSQGASTLTMQYVRNALRDGADSPEAALEATEQTDARKIREMKLALELEHKMTKTQILEGYLNVAYFGHRAYGINAAAAIYFSTTPEKLTLPQAAMIAGIVQAPTTYDPTGSDKAAALERRNYVIERMASLGYISSAVAKADEAQPISLKLSTRPNDCISVSSAHNDWGLLPTCSRPGGSPSRRSARPHRTGSTRSSRAAGRSSRRSTRATSPSRRAPCSRTRAKTASSRSARSWSSRAPAGSRRWR